MSFAWLEGETLLGTSAQLTTSLSTTGDHTLVLTVTDDEGVTRGDAVTVRVELVDDIVQVFFDGFTGGFGTWETGGDVQLSSDPFPDPPQARLGASGAFLRHSIDLPAGATGMTLSFWGKSSQFAARDELLVKVSADGGPFTTIRTFTSADSDDAYDFYGGSAEPLGLSWFPATAANIVVEFESEMTTGLFSVDLVKVRAIIGPVDPDSDGDGTPDDIDGCPADPNKTAPGVCGCGLADVDPDGDGTVDCNAGACGCVLPPCEDPCPSDINGDGVINVLDLIDLLLCFGLPADPPCDAGQDVNGDGSVNVLDLIDLLLVFGTACP